ncbi:hypothetical protein EWM64_g10330 [Hericium alpestre]|uniref:Uncharacterized protein n=1 Tax=Hericium alpestre TaxID=135208 RepID=A0A4Y9ZGG2_9AGAM|nr:hypothetical protein EWM64_g10330 [Hericium alpestre]
MAALLGALNKDGLSQLTYEGLMAKVLAGIPGHKGKRKGELIQHPQCEGRNKQRAVFDGRALGWNRRLVPIALLSKERVRIETGAIHGVALGSEFGVWPEKNATIDPPRGRLVATEVFSVYSFVKAEAGFAPQHGWYAGVSWWANAGDPCYLAFREETAQDECQRVLAERLQLASSGQSRDGIEVAGVLGKPAVPLISVRDRVMKVERTDPYTGAVDVELPCPGPKEGLELLNRILRFELHLARTNPANPLLRTLEFSIVRVDAGGTPVSQNLFDELHRAFLPNDDANYHFIVTNKGSNPLWVFVYYFDPATYTVAEFYAPPSNTMEPPLKPNNKLIIGNENSGVHPFSFIMKEGLEEDSGFAKIFVSETYTDLAMLEEQDEFIYVDPRRTRAGTALSKHGVWDSMVTTITVRR